MKGIILAGGTGTRLLPSTAITSKQLLPVYDRPMIFYPLNTLLQAGITEILIIVSPHHSGNYLNLLGSLLQEHGIRISFIVQKEPRGLAEAYILARDFLDNDSSTLILGDNIFESNIVEAVSSFSTGGLIFAKKTPNPERFGVVEFNEKGKVISIEEKPTKAKSDYAIPGVYIFDNQASVIASSLSPSNRGEFEITDIQREYLSKGELEVKIMEGGWFDTGTHDSLLDASLFVREKKLTQKFQPILNIAIEKFNGEFKRITSIKKV
ncbi:MAG: sugar phosphate nucleotidyltransferase [Candidatus Paceibacterota bacterium]